MQSPWASRASRPLAVPDRFPAPSRLLDLLLRYEVHWGLPLLLLALPNWPLAWPCLMLAGAPLVLRTWAGRPVWGLSGSLGGPLWLFLAAVAAGVPISVDPDLALQALRSYLAWSILFLLLPARDSMRRLRRWLALGTVALLAVTPLCFAPAVQENRKILAFNAWAFDLAAHLPVEFFRAPHPNGVAVGLAVALPLLMAAALDGRSRRACLGWTGLVAASLLFIGLSASRTAWVGAALGMATLVMLRGGRSLRWTLLLALVSLGPMLLLSRPSRDDVRWLSSTWSLMERRQQWANTVELLAQHPLRGVGPGSFPQLYPATMGPGDLRPHASPNNAYLQVYVDGGLPAVVALVWFGLALARRLLGMRPRRGRWGRWEAGLVGSVLVLGWSGVMETSTVVAFIWSAGPGTYRYLASPVPYLLAAFTLLIEQGRADESG